MSLKYILILVGHLTSIAVSQYEATSKEELAVDPQRRIGRFVADTNKNHLIQRVDAEEQDKFCPYASTTTTTMKPKENPDQVNRQDDATEEESSEVVNFEYTEHASPRTISVYGFLGMLFNLLSSIVTFLLGNANLFTVFPGLWFLDKLHLDPVQTFLQSFF